MSSMSGNGRQPIQAVMSPQVPPSMLCLQYLNAQPLSDSDQPPHTYLHITTTAGSGVPATSTMIHGHHSQYASQYALAGKYMPGLDSNPPHSNPAGQGIQSTAPQHIVTVMSHYASSSTIPPVQLQGQFPPVVAEHFPKEDLVIGDCVIPKDMPITLTTRPLC